MKIVNLIFLLVASSAAFSFAFAEDAPNSDVVVLTNANFDTLTKQGTWLVEFYAPWCGHCKKLAPTWEQLATGAKGKFNVAKVDCTVEKDLANRFGIRGYPTVKLLKDGKLYDYAGQRTVEDFTKFVEEGYSSTSGRDIPAAGAPTPASPTNTEVKRDPNAPSDVVVLTTANFDDQIKSGTWLVEFYAPWCGHCKNLAPTWEALATSAKGKFNVAKVDATVEKDLGTRFGIRGYPTVKLIKDGKVYDYKGQRTVEDFTAFATNGYATTTPTDLPPKSASSPPMPTPTPTPTRDPNQPSDVEVLTTANFYDKVSSGGLWFVEFYAPWCGHCKNLAPTWESLATEVKGKYHVAKVDATVEKDLATAFGIRGFPTLKLITDGKVYEYKGFGQRTIEDFKRFLDGGYSTVTPSDMPAKPIAKDEL